MSKIMVIDDSKMMRIYLRRCLEKAGYEVEEWLPLSAMEVPNQIATSMPDLILSDYQMPGCNGATLVRMAHKANPKLPVLILTAFRDEDMESNLLRLGVRQVLTKPIVAESLIQAVAGALNDQASDAE
ncbi:MAG: response regulator [Holophaga sp.]|nr:response regulator [Holophaga sp.]